MLYSHCFKKCIKWVWILLTLVCLLFGLLSSKNAMPDIRLNITPSEWNNIGKWYIFWILRVMPVLQCLHFVSLMLPDATGLKEKIWFRRNGRKMCVIKSLKSYRVGCSCPKCSQKVLNESSDCPLQNDTKHNTIEYVNMSLTKANSKICTCVKMCFFNGGG